MKSRSVKEEGTSHWTQAVLGNACHRLRWKERTVTIPVWDVTIVVVNVFAAVMMR